MMRTTKRRTVVPTTMTNMHLKTVGDNENELQE